ncbi:MAG: Nudix family hydrolase [Gammaproteobacteria bacterium]|nr:Nudix family hydrolase [Gammaproteobacteria bacterium]
MEPIERIHVAAGVIYNRQGEVLITRRAKHVHQGGLWEFPGGKLEADEIVQQALARELEEELGIRVVASEALIRIHYDYPDKKVLLDVWRVSEYAGEAHGREGQPLQWVAPDQLYKFTFPDANLPVVNAACLPDQYLVTGAYTDEIDFISRLGNSLKRGIRLLQLRLKDIDKSNTSLIEQAVNLCRQYNACVLLNTDVEHSMQFDLGGVHLNSMRLMKYQFRPVDKSKYLAASIHNMIELEQAHKIGVDFIVVSPVHKTLSHQDAIPIGWQGLYELTEASRCPVYALGGMTLEDIHQAKKHGAQGIAAISALWGDNHVKTNS